MILILHQYIQDTYWPALKKSTEIKGKTHLLFNKAFKYQCTLNQGNKLTCILTCILLKSYIKHNQMFRLVLCSKQEIDGEYLLLGTQVVPVYFFSPSVHSMRERCSFSMFSVLFPLSLHTLVLYVSQALSICCKWAPLCGSTNHLEWFTVKCL